MKKLEGLELIEFRKTQKYRDWINALRAKQTAKINKREDWRIYSRPRGYKRSKYDR